MMGGTPPGHQSSAVYPDAVNSSQFTYASFSFAIINCRSLIPKLPLLRLYVEMFHTDFLFLTETW